MSEDDIHIIPVDDLKEHENVEKLVLDAKTSTIKSYYCHCSPRVDKEDNEPNLIIHNSYDGRELTEPENISNN